MKHWRDTPHGSHLHFVIGALDAPEILRQIYEKEWEFAVMILDGGMLDRAEFNVKQGRGFGVTICHPTWEDSKHALGHDDAYRQRMRRARAWRRIFVEMIEDNETGSTGIKRRLRKLNEWLGDDVVTQLAALGEDP